MKNPACLVDGHLEKKFVQRTCPNMMVRLLQCNGDNVALEAIAKRIVTQCMLLHGKHYPIIVVVDREDRKQSAVDIATQLLSLVRAEEITDELIVAVADRNIENWIIADSQAIKAVYPNFRQTWSGTPDGFNGEAKLRRALGGTYHKTTDGVDLLLKCKPSAMRKSPSFDYFYQHVKEIGCWWIDK
jgi:hypothetical protein